MRCDAKRLEEIAARASAASAGPWAAPGLRVRSQALAGREIAVMATGDAEALYDQAQVDADGAFVAHSRQDVEDLVGDLRDARAEAAALRRRYETPLYPRVLDDALVQLLRGAFLDDKFRPNELLPLAEGALADRRRMAELLAASAVAASGERAEECAAGFDAGWAAAVSRAARLLEERCGRGTVLDLQPERRLEEVAVVQEVRRLASAIRALLPPAEAPGGSR